MKPCFFLVGRKSRIYGVGLSRDMPGWLQPIKSSKGPFRRRSYSALTLHLPVDSWFRLAFLDISKENTKLTALDEP
jgi:hypothetical protein